MSRSCDLTSPGRAGLSRVRGSAFHAVLPTPTHQFMQYRSYVHDGERCCRTSARLERRERACTSGVRAHVQPHDSFVRV
eukprot:5498390-Pleurochrysis_carterae.AAC.1